jgi:Mycolic acid cyclopropane synthetase
VVGLSISKEQRDFAQKRIQEAGLDDKVEIRLQDHRDERDRYDRIASIEMIEAVGEEFWPNYFSQLCDRLLPGGLAGIQAITIRDSSFKSYRREVDFIQRHAFPGGMLPSPQIRNRSASASVCLSSASAFSGKFMPRRWRPGAIISAAPGRTSRRSASTSASARSGNITSLIARPDSCPAISMCDRSSSQSS